MSDAQSCVALVTGGTSGIGRALVSRLLRQGVTVYTTGRSQKRWDQAVSEDPSLANARFRVADMADFDALEPLVDRIISSVGALDVLVNNAGIMPIGATHEISGKSVAQQLDVLLEGPIRLTQSALQQMLQQPSGGHIINISSIAATVPSPRMAVYASAKAGLLQFTKSIAAEYADNNIRANAVLPGPIETCLADRMLIAQIARNSTAGRPGKPDEVSALIVYLLGADATFINGSAITIDGGVSLGVTPSRSIKTTTKQPITIGEAAGSVPIATPVRQVVSTANNAAAAPIVQRATISAADIDTSLLPKVAAVFGKVFSFNDMTFETSPEDVDKWDSLGHMKLVGELETQFSVRFEVDEVMEMTTAGAIMEILTRRLQAG